MKVYDCIIIGAGPGDFRLQSIWGGIIERSSCSTGVEGELRMQDK